MPTIIDMVRTRIETSGDNPVMLGNRYQITQLREIDQVDQKGDHKRFTLEAIDCHSIPQKTRTIILTQVGLKFSNRVLQPTEIVRANALFQEHNAWLEQHRPDSDGPDGSEARLGPMILSHAGIGRNAVLIAYRDICKRIVEHKKIDLNSLDKLIKQAVLAGRASRGSKFLHSKEQLGALRQALVDKLNLQPIQPVRPEGSARNALLREWRSSASPLRQAAEHTPTQQTPTSPWSAGGREGWFNRFRQSAQRPVLSSNDVVTNTGLLTRVTGLFRTRQNPVGYEAGEDGFSLTPPRSPSAVSLEGASSPELSNVPPTVITSSHLLERNLDELPVQTDDRIQSGMDRPMAKSSDGINMQPFSAHLAPMNEPLADRPEAVPSHRCGRIGVRLSNAEIDLYTIDERLLTTDHQARKLATDKNGSWYQAAFLSVLLESDADHFDEPVAQRLYARILALGDDFKQEASIVKSMSEKAKSTDTTGGIHAILTDLEPATPPEYFRTTQSRLKAVGENDNDLDRPGEDAVKKIAQAMLLKAGYSDIEIERLFDPLLPQEGNSADVFNLIHQLGGNFGAIYERTRLNQNSYPAINDDVNFNTAVLEFSKAEVLDSLAHTGTVGKNKDGDTQQIGDFLDRRPVILLEDGHFSMCVPLIDLPNKANVLMREMEIFSF